MTAVISTKVDLKGPPVDTATSPLIGTLRIPEGSPYIDGFKTASTAVSVPLCEGTLQIFDIVPWPSLSFHTTYPFECVSTQMFTLLLGLI